MQYNDISFTAADGTVLRGRHYAAQNVEGPSPVIVMAHGFAGVIELLLAPFAEAFAKAGLAVVVYDHRNFGISDGAIRQEIDPHQQVNDWREAITFAQSLPGVDPDRVGIWGSSFSGGHVLYLAATDRRVKCVVSQVPFVSGSQTVIRNLRPDVIEMSNAAFAGDRKARLAGEAPAMIPVVTDNPMQPAALQTREAFDWTMKYIDAVPTFRNEVTLRSMEFAGAYEPGVHIGRIAPTPLLMIVGTRDQVTVPDDALSAYATAREPKRLVLFDGGHFDPYDIQFDTASAAAIEWFQLNLAPKK